MSDIAIRVENLGKSYRIAHNRTQGRYKTLQEDVIGLLKRPFQRGVSTPTTEEFWALKDISFEVKQGEVLGIIGRNGAGKSTLLKILSRITRPTTGYAEMHGRIGSLLEVGTGFHPELTGRENIFLNGAVLGMSRRDIEKRFDEIVAFADVEKFLDTPAKRYSSGMYMRLAFAVAAHLEPEILVVDEVLAVGDAEFQKKSLGKMSEVAQSGRTVLFVSHNMPAVESLCSRAILLHRGTISISNETKSVLQAYKEGQTTSITLNNKVSWTSDTYLGNERARLVAAQVTQAIDKITSSGYIDEAFEIVVEYDVIKPDTVLNISISIYNEDDIYVLASPSLTDDAWYQRPHPIGRYRSKCYLPPNLLNSGVYYVSVLLVEQGQNVIAEYKKGIMFEVLDSSQVRGQYFGPWYGVVRPLLNWSTVVEENPTLDRSK